jgi:hypothetical protein
VIVNKKGFRAEKKHRKKRAKMKEKAKALRAQKKTQ